MNFSTEAELHKLFLQAIESESLLDLINDAAGIETHALADRTDMFPQFSIDHLSRREALQAGKCVLDSFSMLEVLTSDKNVSITTKEVMRPDIVCVNPEQQSIVIFEFKKAAETGRQSLTELLAYEQEIKNLLPFLSNYDVNFVLVSSEWSTLMDHAISAAITWSNRKILCLEAALSDGELELQTRVPVAWRITGSVYLPAEAMSCVNISLYDKDAYTPDWKKDLSDNLQLDPRIWTALEIIAREGDRSGSHGFALLSRDWRPESLTNYNLTICGIAPFAIFKMNRLQEMVQEDDGHLVEKLDQFLVEHDPSGHSEALMILATSAHPLLEEVSDPQFEAFMSWPEHKLMLENVAEPLLCEFWGTLGDYARKYVMHPAIRTHRRNLLQNGRGDWRSPVVGLQLIQSFTQPEIFYEGEVRCSDAFRIGLLIGVDSLMRANLQQNNSLVHSLKCRFEWNYIELMAAIDEVRLLANAATNVNAPAEAFKFYNDYSQIDEAGLDKFILWLVKDFFQDSPSHALFFEVGYNGCVYFDQNKRNPWDEALPKKYLENVEDSLRSAITMVWLTYKQLEAEGSLWGELESNLRNLESALGLDANKSLESMSVLELLSAWPIILNTCDAVLFTAFHKHSPVATAPVDWTWLKQGVKEMRERGTLDAGVILLPSGQLVTGSVSPVGLNVFTKIEDPASQVLFLDRSNGFGLMRTVAWSDLEDGTAFRKLKPKTDKGAEESLGAETEI